MFPLPWLFSCTGYGHIFTKNQPGNRNWIPMLYDEFRKEILTFIVERGVFD